MRRSATLLSVTRKPSAMLRPTLRLVPALRVDAVRGPPNDPRRRGPPVLERRILGRRSERPQRSPAVADAVLLRVRELGHRPVPSRRHEDRVVAEAARPARLRLQRPLTEPLGDGLVAEGRDPDDHAPVPGGPAGRRHALDGPDQLLEVLPVARVLAGEPGRARAGA